MRQRIAFYVVLAALAAAFVAPALAVDVDIKRLVRLDGWVVDEWCGKENADPSKIDCVLECNKKGAPLVFVASDGEMYKLDNQKKSLEFVGRHVKVFGTVDGSMNLNVGSFYEIEKAEEAEGEAEAVADEEAPADS